MLKLCRGEYTAAQRYEYCIEHTFISASHYVVFFSLFIINIDKLTLHNHEKVENNIINIFTSEDMENTPLGSWM